MFVFTQFKCMEELILRFQSHHFSLKCSSLCPTAVKMFSTVHGFAVTRRCFNVIQSLCVVHLFKELTMYVRLFKSCELFRLVEHNFYLQQCSYSQYGRGNFGNYRPAPYTDWQILLFVYAIDTIRTIRIIMNNFCCL